MESFCFPFVDEGEACDQNGNWSCPCRDSLVCTSNSRSKGKGKGKEKNWRKYYMPEVVLEEEQECPTLYKAKRKDPDKYTPTCQKVNPHAYYRNLLWQPEARLLLFNYN